MQNTLARAASEGSLRGKSGFVEFDTGVNVWDVHAGRRMPDMDVYTGGTFEVWDSLNDDLSQSAWRQSTRRLYQGWLRVYLAVCDTLQVPPLPVEVRALEELVTRVAAQHAFGTVQVAASAVIGFCALNNVGNPFESNPRVKLKMKAVRALKADDLRAAKKAIDAEFVLDMWRVCGELAKGGELSIADKRAKAFCQLAFEAAMRGHEISHLKMCDLQFLGCGEACGKKGACMQHEGRDAWLFVRLAKTARDAKVQATRLVWPDSPTKVLGESVSVLSCMTSDWLPFLYNRGLFRNDRCTSSAQSRYRCDLCPPLFPTFPSRNSSILRSVAVSTVTKGFQRMATLTGREPKGYTSHSGRLGGYSTATAEGCMPAVASRSMRWANERVPEKVYKRDNERESRMAGAAIHRGISGAMAGASKKETEKVSAPPVTPKKLKSGRAECPFKKFPMQVRVVGKKEVCRRFQFAACPNGGACKYAHVCHACGAAHASSCKAGQEAVARWRRGLQSKVRSPASSKDGQGTAVHVSPSPSVRSSPRFAGRRM